MAAISHKKTSLSIGEVFYHALRDDIFADPADLLDLESVRLENIRHLTLHHVQQRCPIVSRLGVER